MGAPGLFEHFSTLARRVVARAVQEAKELGHEEAGSEHMLFALASLPGPVADVFGRLGVSADAIRSRILEEQPAGPAPEVMPEPMSEEEAADLARQLRAQGIPRPRIQEIVDRIQRRRAGHVDLSEVLKATLERALLEGSDSVGTVDLARALLTDPPTVVFRILGWIGPAPPDVLRQLEEAPAADPG